MAFYLVFYKFILVAFLADFPLNIETTKLPKRVDLCIVTAFGGRYNGKFKYKSVEIAKLVAERMSVSPSTTRLAMITSKKRPRVEFGLNTCVNRECILAALKKISTKRLGHNSKTSGIGKALYLALKLFKEESRYDAKKYVLLITDSSSVSNGKVSHISRRLRQEQVSTYVMIANAKFDYRVYEGLQKLTGGMTKTRVVVVASRDDLNPAVAALPFAKVSYSKCNGDKQVIDKCERRCKCRNGKLTKCVRVRKEFTEMTIKERKRYINALKTLASNPIYKTRYSNFVQIHKDLFFKGIHTANFFLPWHRWYILSFENMLREIDCRITVPYWDWAFWSNSAWQKNIHIWNNKDYGLGGDGDPKRGYCVQDGPFREGVFKTPSFDDPIEVLKTVDELKRRKVICNKLQIKSRCLRRSFSGKPVGIPKIKLLLMNKAASFSKFEEAVRLMLHNSMHNEIGGHMCSEYASVAPEFFLHHTFLDKVWYTWQQHSTACMKARFSHLLNKMTAFACPHSQHELLNSNRLPGKISVTYTDYYYSAKKGNKFGKPKEGLYEENNKIANTGRIHGENQGFLNEENFHSLRNRKRDVSEAIGSRASDEDEANNDGESNNDEAAKEANDKNEKSDEIRSSDSYTSQFKDSSQNDITADNNDVEMRTWPPYGEYRVELFI